MEDCASCALRYVVSSYSTIDRSIATAYVFETIQVLVPLPTGLAVEGLFLLHAKCTGIRRTRFGVHDRESAVSVLVQLLGLVTMCLMVPKTEISNPA